MSAQHSRQTEPSRRTPPGPGGSPLGSLRALERDRLDSCAARRDHGDVVRIRIGPFTCLFSSHPSEVTTSPPAGYATGAMALAWTLCLLNRHPEVRVQVRELVSVLANRLPFATRLAPLRTHRRSI